jgi:pyruvate dehydrogenase E1 component alpha subunit
MIHARLQRYYGHFEGDAMTYRAPNEVETLRRERDPLSHFRKRVTEGGLLEARQLDELDSEIVAMIDAVTRRAKAAAVPAPERLLTDVYVSY